MTVRNAEREKRMMKKGGKRKRDRGQLPKPDVQPPKAKTPAQKVPQPWTWVEVACLLLIAVAGLYVAVRASRLELSGGEAGCLQDSLKPGLETMLTLEHLDPRNSLLPGVLALPFLKLWPGDSLTGIRIPSVLSFFVFAWVGWRLGRRLKRGWLRVALLLGWFGNAFLLEWFSQVRGFGWMVAFSSLAYTGVIDAYDRRGGPARQRLWSYLSILAAAAAMLAVMGFASGFCAVAGLLVLRYGLDAELAPDLEAAEGGHPGWRWRLGAAWNQSGFIFATVLAVAVFYLPRYLILQDHPAMQGWGGNGFLRDTMAAAVDTLPHALPNVVTPYLPMIAGAVAALMAINAIAAGIGLWQREKTRGVRAFLKSPTILLAALFAGAWVLSVLAHALAGASYPVRPTALFLWPLVVAQCVFAMDEAEGVWKWPVRGLNLAVLAVVLAVAARSLNLDHCEANEPTAHQSAIVREIAKLAQESRGRPVVAGVSGPLKDTFGYYMEKTCGLKESPQTERNPVFKMFGNNLYIYSLDYELPVGAEWHWHPAVTHYLLSEHAGHRPDPTLMETSPVIHWPEMRAGLYRALPQGTTRGCDPATCGICNYFREMTQYRPPNQ